MFCLSKIKKRMKLLLSIFLGIVCVTYFFIIYLGNVKRLLYPCDISKEKNDALRTLIKTLTRAFEVHNVTYWVDYGTALGAYRYCDVIPWDIDADISYLDKDHNKVIRAVEDIIKDRNFVYHKDMKRLEYRHMRLDLFRWVKFRNWWTFNSVYYLLSNRFDTQSDENYMLYRTNLRKYNEPITFVINFFSDYLPLTFLRTRSRVKFADFEVYATRNLTELVQKRYYHTYDKVVPHSIYCLNAFYNSTVVECQKHKSNVGMA